VIGGLLTKLLQLTAILFLGVFGFALESITPGKHPDDLYFAQKPPGINPELFAPGIISTEKYFEISCTLTPDGKEFYFTRRGGEFGDTNTILVSKLMNGTWTKPEVALFSGTYFDYEPHISPDGKKLLFGTDRPAPADAEPGHGGNIWYVEREGDKWGDPVYHCSGMFASITKDGALYVTRGRDGISRQEFKEGKYLKFESLDDPINLPRADFHPFISPDESYLIFDSYDRPENIGGADLYISFRNKEGIWSNPDHLGTKINTQGWEGCPFVSRDGKYFFFTREGDIYWVSTKVFQNHP
jgi:Tol biopolymer transport system component